MSARTVTLVLVIAAVAGWLGARVGWHLATPPGPPSEEYLVAVRNLNPGTAISDVEKQFRSERRAIVSSPPGAFRPVDSASLRGKVLMHRLAEGDILTANDFVAAKDLKERPTTTRIPEGFRAVAVPIRTNDFGEWTPAGNKVDLFLVSKGNLPINRFVQDVKVLDVKVPIPLDHNPNIQGWSDHFAMIVAVKPHDAERITWAMGQPGRIIWSVRMPGDHTIHAEPPIRGLDPEPGKNAPPDDKK